MFLLNFLLVLVILSIFMLMTFMTVYEKRVDLYSGFCLGMSFFIGGPLVILAFFGYIPNSDLPIPPVYLEKDTILLLYIFLFVFCLFFGYLISRKFTVNNVEFDASDAWFSYLIILLYFTFTVITFQSYQKWAGGHWHATAGEVMSGNPLVVIISNFQNVLRVVYPMIVAYLTVNGKIKNRTYLFLIISYLTVELLLINNRIVVLFAIISLIVVYQDRLKLLAFWGVLSFPFVLFLNHAYPIARGLMWSDGFSMAGVAKAFTIAVDTRKNDVSDDFLGGSLEMVGSLFEATNIIVLKYVINNFNSIDSYYWGSTVVLKSVLFFVPQSMWSGKPSGFGGDVGYAITGHEGLTLNTTSLGEFYGNFGYVSFVMLPVLLLVLQKLRRILPRNGWVDYALFLCGFSAIRFEFSFLVISFFLLACLLFSYSILNLISGSRK